MHANRLGPYFGRKDVFVIKVQQSDGSSPTSLPILVLPSWRSTPCEDGSRSQSCILRHGQENGRGGTKTPAPPGLLLAGTLGCRKDQCCNAGRFLQRNIPLPVITLISSFAAYAMLILKRLVFSLQLPCPKMISSPFYPRFVLLPDKNFDTRNTFH